MKASHPVDAQAAALARAREHGIRVAPLTDEAWRAESAEPSLRGPYLCIGDGTPEGWHCECTGSRFEPVCHHRSAVLAAIAGDYPICDLEAIRAPAQEAPARRETRRERWAREVAEHDAAHVARMATPAATITERDYDTLFPE
jgi:hypothetical protein